MEYDNYFNTTEPGNMLPLQQQFFRIAPQSQMIFKKPAQYHIEYIGKINNNFVFKATEPKATKTGGYFCVEHHLQYQKQLWVPKLHKDTYSALRNPIVSCFAHELMHINGEYINTAR